MVKLTEIFIICYGVMKFSEDCLNHINKIRIKNNAFISIYKNSINREKGAGGILPPAVINVKLFYIVIKSVIIFYANIFT